MFIKYSTGLLPPKKSRDDNIIPEPDVDLELGKSISLIEAAEEEASRQVHATHERIMSPDPSQKLKGVQMLTPEEQLAADTMKALKANRKSSINEGTGTKLVVPVEEKVTSEAKADAILDWGSEQESEYSEEDDDENIEWIDTDEEEEKNDDDDDKSIDLEKTNDEETDDEFILREKYVQKDDEETDDETLHGDEQVNDDENEEVKNAEDADTGNSDEEITVAAKADAKKTKEVKDDIKKAELPPTSSSLSDTTNAEINSLLDVQIQQEIPHIQSPSVLTVPVSVISEPSVLISIPETPSVAPATTLLPLPSVSTISNVLLQSTTLIFTPPITTEAPPITTIPDPLPAISQRVSVLEKEIQELKEADNTTTLRASHKYEIPSTVNAYLGSSLGDALRKNALEKTPLLLAQSSSQAQSSLKAAYQANPKKVLRKRDRDNEDPSAGPNQGKKTKRCRTKESKPSKKSSTYKQSSKGKSPAKTSKSGKSVTIEEPVFKMAYDEIEQTVDDVAKDADQPSDDLTQTKDKYPKKYWFKQHPRPPIPD
ncbi:hypothetical protein Tco_1577292 [Tanacetum coccineum]